jgi:diacylglycerol kinase (ATP)
MLVLTNDTAGRTEAEAVETVLGVLRASRTPEVVVCDAATDLDAVLDRRGDGPVVVVGGDGSLHTTVTHLWRRGEAGSTAVGLVPLGTGNDFARGCGIPLDPRAAAELILAGGARPTDLLTDDAGGVVVNAVHVGVGAEAARLARPLKRYLKIGAFPIGSLLAGFRTPGQRLRVVVDGVRVATWRAKVLMAGASNAPTIAGGTATLGPDASPEDGLLDVTVSFAVGPLARIGYALRLLRGRHPERDDVVYRQGRTLSITGEPFFVNADGELTGPITARSWTVQPGGWRFIRPSAAERSRTAEGAGPGRTLEDG